MKGIVLTDTTDVPQKPPYRDSDAAPFIYFDVAPTFGTMGGAIQIELAARILTPGDEMVTSTFVATGRLRCSPAAAQNLVQALSKALEMIEQPQGSSGSGSATLN
ncbi:MAG: hypothetical protein EOR99_32655 [Mesorhizobium sp.]|nr:MAG: hypothetical protein EOR99_32655 [Mesorhizobium sp.]